MRHSICGKQDSGPRVSGDVIGREGFGLWENHEIPS